MIVWMLTLGAVLLLVLGLAVLGRWIVPKGHPARARAHAAALPAQPPKAAMIIPMTGASPHLEPALRSLLAQDYQDHTVVLVTQDEADPATGLARELAAAFPHARHVLAGLATRGGQKTHNQLAALDTVDAATELLVFCDSTHLAQPNFLRCLVEPLMARQARVATGYHVVRPEDARLPTLGQALCVVALHGLQGVPFLRQPWGGAMVMTRQAFDELDVATLWRTNIVDDVSLAGRLQDRGERVAFAPAACTETRLSQTWAGWRHWLTRQLAYPRFIMPGTWLGIGAAIGVACLTVGALFGIQLWETVAGMGAFFSSGPGQAPVSLGMELLQMGAMGLLLGAFLVLRPLLVSPPPVLRWLFLCVTFLPLFMALWCFWESASTRVMHWRHQAYVLGKGGVVEEIITEPPE